MVDSIGEPICVAQCPWLPGELSVADRIVDCLTSAIGQSLMPLEAHGIPTERVPVTLLVNLPPERPGLPESLVDAIRQAIIRVFRNTFSRIGIARCGHAGGVLALQSAITALARHPVSACVIAAADSYMEPDTLEWLEETGQLHGAGEANNAWGFVPGEGGGAALLTLPPVAEQMALAPLGHVVGVGSGREAQLIRTGSVCLGEGLTAAMRDALGSLPNERTISDVYCDMNGDPYRADEFAFAVTRTRERFISASDFVAPADCWGDVGSASAPLLTALACIAGAKGYSKGPDALIWASSDTGERGAAVVGVAGST